MSVIKGIKEQRKEGRNDRREGKGTDKTDGCVNARKQAVKAEQ